MSCHLILKSLMPILRAAIGVSSVGCIAVYMVLSIMAQTTEYLPMIWLTSACYVVMIAVCTFMENAIELGTTALRKLQQKEAATVSDTAQLPDTVYELTCNAPPCKDEDTKGFIQAFTGQINMMLADLGPKLSIVTPQINIVDITKPDRPNAFALRLRTDNEHRGAEHAMCIRLLGHFFRRWYPQQGTDITLRRISVAESPEETAVLTHAHMVLRGKCVTNLEAMFLIAELRCTFPDLPFCSVFLHPYLMVSADLGLPGLYLLFGHEQFSAEGERVTNVLSNLAADIVGSRSSAREENAVGDFFTFEICAAPTLSN